MKADLYGEIKIMKSMKAKKTPLQRWLLANGACKEAWVGRKSINTTLSEELNMKPNIPREWIELFLLIADVFDGDGRFTAPYKKLLCKAFNDIVRSPTGAKVYKDAVNGKYGFYGIKLP